MFLWPGFKTSQLSVKKVYNLHISCKKWDKETNEIIQYNQKIVYGVTCYFFHIRNLLKHIYFVWFDLNCLMILIWI